MPSFRFERNLCVKLALRSKKIGIADARYSVFGVSTLQRILLAIRHEDKGPKRYGMDIFSSQRYNLLSEI